MMEFAIILAPLIDEQGLFGLTNALIGVETGFVIESRDSDNGMSDAFLSN
jgi:hypothetical protein